jgi:hypothetical protein
MEMFPYYLEVPEPTDPALDPWTFSRERIVAAIGLLKQGANHDAVIQQLNFATEALRPARIYAKGPRPIREIRGWETA